jgi:hypothetical protein
LPVRKRGAFIAEAAVAELKRRQLDAQKARTFNQDDCRGQE